MDASNSDFAPRSRLLQFGLALLLIGTTICIYVPALHGPYIFDDATHIAPTKNWSSISGLGQIWTTVGITNQYYPLVESFFWLEYKLWGESVLGFHLSNVFEHAVAALLVVAIMHKLRLRGGWLAAFVFAVHPICVESVAYISEQKNTLAMLFSLSSLLAYLKYDESRKSKYYWISFGFFVLALLSKSVTATMPGAILVIQWWKSGRLTWKENFKPLMLWVAVGLVSGLFTSWVERKYSLASGPKFELGIVQHVLLAGRIICFYIGKLFCPTNIMFIYPRWHIDTRDISQYGFIVSLLIIAASLLLLSRKNRGPLASFLLFCGTLFPVLGFLNIYYFVFSYVADHFQYFACPAIIGSVSCLLVQGWDVIAKQSKWMGAALAMILVAWLGRASYIQCHIYDDTELLWHQVLSGDPNSVVAHNNLGLFLIADDRRRADGIAELNSAIKIDDQVAETHNNLGIALAKNPTETEKAALEFEKAIQLKPELLEAHINRAHALELLPRRRVDAISEYQWILATAPGYDNRAYYELGMLLSETKSGLVEAEHHFRMYLESCPNSSEGHYALGTLLLRDSSKLPEAISELRKALQINPSDVFAHNNLGNALARTPGHTKEAITEYETALRIDPTCVDCRNNLERIKANVPQGGGR